MNIQKTKYIRPSEIAKLLQLNLLTIYDYIHQGHLRAVKFGRTYRIEEKDLEKFIKKSEVKRQKK